MVQAFVAVALLTGAAEIWMLAVTFTSFVFGAASAFFLRQRPRPRRPLVGTFAGWSLSALPALALVPPLPTVLIAVAYGGAAALVVVSCAAGIATPSVRAITRAAPALVVATSEPSVR